MSGNQRNKTSSAFRDLKKLVSRRRPRETTQLPKKQASADASTPEPVLYQNPLSNQQSAERTVQGPTVSFPCLPRAWYLVINVHVIAHSRRQAVCYIHALQPLATPVQSRQQASLPSHVKATGFVTSLSCSEHGHTDLLSCRVQ